LVQLADNKLYYENENDELEDSEDWIQYALDLPMTAEPGTVFRYCNVNAFLLSAIISQTTGRKALELARELMFKPLGIADAVRDATPQGHSDGSGGVTLTPHGWAAFGQLFLQQGAWGGEQIISRSWVTASTAVHVPEYDYCYLWGWQPDPGFHYASGAQGQFLVVAPSLDLVAVFTGGGHTAVDGAELPNRRRGASARRRDSRVRERRTLRVCRRPRRCRALRPWAPRNARSRDRRVVG
jgi:CubicO group peptidase (beta-lactamase class C family)